MEELNIVTVNEVRDINTVTTEINTLVNQYRSLTLAYAVEVGRRLTEAKSLLPHGEWGAWLNERVSFSQRTANNLMRVFEEYGDSQITLFGAVPNSHAISNLPLTHAIKLLLLPAEEREEFLETEDVASMSARELEEAIKARKAAEDRAEELEQEAERLNEDLNMIDTARSKAVSELHHTQEDLERARTDAETAQEKARVAQETAKTATEAAEKARADLKKLKDKLKELKENTEVPQELIDKLTAEAMEKATAETEEQLKKAVDDANKKILSAEEAKKDAEKRYEELRQQAQLADPDIMSFKALFEQVQDTVAKLHSAFYSIADRSPEMAEKLRMALERFSEEVVPK